MNRNTRGALALILAARLTTGAGMAFACSGNYCENVDTLDCVYVGLTEWDSCCKSTANGMKCLSCQRQCFLCLPEYMIRWGGGYNCHSPGASCQ